MSESDTLCHSLSENVVTLVGCRDIFGGSLCPLPAVYFGLHRIWRMKLTWCKGGTPQKGGYFGRVVADVWEKDVWDFQAKSGSSGSCRIFLRFLGKIAVPKMSKKAPGSPRHPSSRQLRPSDLVGEIQKGTAAKGTAKNVINCRIILLTFYDDLC